MNIVNWARRKLFNTRARDISSKVLAAPLPVAQARNRAERRASVDRHAARVWRRALVAMRAAPKRDYPVLAHCIVGACKRLPRYRNRCYLHFIEEYHATPA